VWYFFFLLFTLLHFCAHFYEFVCERVCLCICVLVNNIHEIERKRMRNKCFVVCYFPFFISLLRLLLFILFHIIIFVFFSPLLPLKWVFAALNMFLCARSHLHNNVCVCVWSNVYYSHLCALSHSFLSWRNYIWLLSVRAARCRKKNQVSRWEGRRRSRKRWAGG
jgi:hypothetical protein